MNFYSILVHAHSGLRWLLLLFLVLAIVDAYRRTGGGKTARWAFMLTHIQLLLGLALYFISPKVQFAAGVMKDSLLRFYTVEHLTGMLIAIALITVGYVRGKKLLPAAEGYKRIFTLYLVSLLIILLSIPWPFRGLGAGWF